MTNPLLTRSPLPFEMPDFGAITAQDYVEAVRHGIAGQLDALRDITGSGQEPTFANTTEAFEASGETLRRATMAFSNVKPSHGTPDILAAHGTIQALLTEHSDVVHLDAALYDRLAAVDAAGGLEGEAARLSAETLRAFRHAGAGLDEAGKTRLRELNGEISALSTRYSAALLATMNDSAVLFDSPADLAGLSEAEIASAARAATEAGHDGGYLLTLVLPTHQPALARLENGASRRRLFEASTHRGQDGEHRTLDLAVAIARLRAERAALLGYPNHAAYVLEAQTAPSLQAVRDRLEALIPPALANAASEAAVMAEDAGHDIAPWDRAYHSARVQRERYAVDAAALKPWFELDRVIHDGVFAAATRLYGVTFAERHDLPVYHPDVRVWEVSDADGSTLGLFLGDYFARPTKAGGAWMNSIRVGASLFGELPVVTNNLNIPAPADGQPALLTLDETRTLFHEFGHALHGLFAAGIYPSLAGTAVPRDFVEYPSQVNEMWQFDEELIAGYARHVDTGEALPDGALDRIHAAELWGEGFATTEYLAAAVLDMAWHSLAPGEDPGEPLAFEDRALREAGFDPAVLPPRYRTGYFKHIFDGGYSAGYYSYIWSEVLDADTVEWFTENGGGTRENGDRFRSGLLSRGNTRDPLESYTDFRGRAARLEPLLVRRGLDAAAR
ncbi:M3 family metallopeptidase [Arthrobacter sp. JSM 101049]|uniref:M3 family metallopeptidase n=1 Tax=Arthrobacter sp. JSM 101049 TaxID=929097 RepID=UPI00356AFBC6